MDSVPKIRNQNYFKIELTRENILYNSFFLIFETFLYFETTSAIRLYSSVGDFRTRFRVGTLKNKSSTVIIVPWLAAHGVDFPVGFPSEYIV